MSTTDLTERSQPLWAGVDVSDKKFDAGLYPPAAAGRPWTMHQIEVRSFILDRTGVEQFLAWARARAIETTEVRVAMEATGKCSLRLAALLIQLAPGMAVSIVNPLFVNRFAASLGTRNKTDGIDARVIARFGAERSPEPWQPPTKQMLELRSLTRERQTIVESLTEHKNRLREATESKLVAKVQTEIIKCLEKQLTKIEKAIKELIALDEQLRHDVQLLDSVVGVGLVTAVTILVELGDLRRFSRARGLAAFSGLSPRQHSSGTSVHGQTRICKTGSDRARRVLHMAAMSTLRNDNRFSRTYLKLKSRGKTHGQALGAVMRKILLVMRAVLKSNTTYIDAHPGCGKLQGTGAIAPDGA
jgi:transposase